MLESNWSPHWVCCCQKTSGLRLRPRPRCGSALSKSIWTYAEGAEMGLLTFLRPGEVMHAHGHPVLNCLTGVQKKDSVLPSGLPILRMIINAIPANAYQELLGGDIAMLPYFAQWNGIQLDREDLVVSWSEADMSAAFWIFRMEPSWFPLQALAKPVPGSFAAQWCPELASESLVYPTVCHDEWKSACGVLQHAHRACALHSLPQGLACQPTFQFAATGRCHARPRASWVRLSPSTWMECRLPSSLQFTSKPWWAPCRPRWPLCRRFGVRIPSQAKEAFHRTDEWETLGCRVAGALGVLAPPRGVISELLGLAGWFCDANPRSVKEFQILAGRWSRCFQFRREASCAFAHLWSAIHTSARPQQPTLVIVLDLLMAICVLPLLRCHMRYRVSPSAIATDASESGFGVVRSSTPTLEGSDELSLRALSTAVACDQPGIIELNAGIGGFRRAVELLERVPGVHAASEDDPAYYRVLETAWPTTVRLPQVAAVRSNHISQLVRSVSHILVWLIGGTIPIHSRLDRSSISRSSGEEDEFFRHFGRIASLVRSAAPYAKIAVMADSDASLNASTVDTISDLFRVRLPPSVFRSFVTYQAPTPFWAFLSAPCLCLRLVVERWPHRWVRTSLCQLPAFTECHPSQRQPSFPQDLSHIEAASAALFGGRTTTGFHWRCTIGTMAWCARVSGVFPRLKNVSSFLGFRRQHTAVSSTQRV